MLKLIYQNEFGGGHMVTDFERAYSYLCEEMAGAPATGFISEDIGNGLCRVYLGEFKNLFGAVETASGALLGMFTESAALKTGGASSFRDKLEFLLEMIKNNDFPGIDKESLPLWARDHGLASSIAEDYKRKGFPPLSHSESYRALYKPAYRIVLKSFIDYMGLFSAIEDKRKQKGSLIIGIDGKCGSGKTTLGNIIKYGWKAQIISMDDFFLPADLRSAERLDSPGGNVHYERFAEEVAAPLKSGAGEISYRVFDCKAMDYHKERKAVKTGGVIVIEGSYCMRPELRDIYDIKVFLGISEEKQKCRIMKRGGGEAFKSFEEKWIPMENKYFDYYNIPGVCDFVYGMGE